MGRGTTRARTLREARPHHEVSVDIVIPVYNERVALPISIPTLCDYLATYVPYRWTVTIADNASTDGTLAVAEELAARLPGVRVLHLDRKGRGLALKEAWGSSQADIVAYMDVDLSTNLSSLMPLIAPLATGHSEVAIGSRLSAGAVVTRQWRRELISRSYNLMIKLSMRNRFSDAQCGFKALTREAARELLPAVENGTWFFDTELLLLAEERGFRIHEVPVDWVEDLDTRVKIVSTVKEDIEGLVRIRRQRLSRRGAALGRRLGIEGATSSAD